MTTDLQVNNNQPAKLHLSSRLLTKVAVILILCAILGYLLSQTLWDLIVLPFNNPFDAVGKLALAEFNPLNNYLRWLIFILLPAFLLMLVLKSKRLDRLIRSSFKSGAQDSDVNLNNAPKSLSQSTVFSKIFKLLLFLLPLTLIYLFFTHTWSTSAFDMFHEGEQLTPALKYQTGKGIWTGSLFVHGALYDLFTAILGWKLFGIQSIGAYRVSVALFVLLKDVSLVILLYIVVKNLENALVNKLSATMLSSLMLTFYLFTSRIHNIDRRMLPVILTLCCLFGTNLIKKHILYFLAGLLSVLGILFSLDSGIYSMIIVLAHTFLTWLFKVGDLRVVIKNLLRYFMGLGIAVLGFYALLGKSEISQFITDFNYFFRVKDLLDSYIYPFPNLLTNLRPTLPLVITAINVLIFTLVARVIYLKSDKLKALAIIHSTLLVTSLVFYRTALGRSDLLHIETSSSFIFIVLGFSLGLLILSLNELDRFVVPTLALSLLLNFGFVFLTFVKANPANLISFPKRMADFVTTNDLDFVNTERRAGIVRLREIFNDQKCIVNLTSEAAMPYLLSKPSCGRIYISYFASAEPVRNEFLTTIVKTSPKYILYSSKSWTQNLDNITNDQRFPNVIKYIQANYEPFETVSGYWTVYSRGQ